MKKNKNILTVTLILALVAVVLIYRTRSGTIKEDLKDFAVKDTAAITQIFLADRNGHSVLLQRKDQGGWMVNNKYGVRREAIKTLLLTIRSVAVKSPVAKAGYNGVIKGLATEGIKCEIYLNNESKPAKVYYVGGSTADVLGTFMMIQNSSSPFVTEIPGFVGYLTPRYQPYEKDWRETTIFDYNPDDIKNITIKYFHDPSQSFSVDRSGNQFNVSSPQTNHVVQHPDTIGLLNYLSYFKSLHFEGWDRDFTDEQRDSLKGSIPLSVVTVTDIKGKTVSMTTFPKPITRSSLAQTDTLGNQLRYDMDRQYAFINNDNDFVTIQHYVFGKIFRQLDDFDLDKQGAMRKSKKK